MYWILKNISKFIPGDKDTAMDKANPTFIPVWFGAGGVLTRCEVDMINYANVS